jgi:hypothetical protein
MAHAMHIIHSLVKQNIVSGLTFKNVFNFKRDKMKY